MPRPEILAGGAGLAGCLLAAHAGVFTGFESVDVAGTTALVYAAVGALVGLAIAAVLLRATNHTSAEPAPRELRSTWRAMAVAIGAIAALTLVPHSPAGPGDAATHTSTTVAGAGDVSATVDPSAIVPPGESLRSSSDVGSGFMGVIIGFGLAGLIAILLTYRRRVVLRRERRSGRSTAPSVSAFPDEEIDDDAAARSFERSARMLLDDPDPRRAVIAAYAALLDGLEGAGVGRRPHEAPEEHLQRALATLRVPTDAAAVVTHLFLVARFSSHPVVEADRQRALGALGVAESHLRSRIAAT